MSKVAHATPVVFRGEIISCAGDCIQSFDPKTGKLLWNVFSLGEGVTATPVIGDGLIFTASGARPATLRTVRTGGKGDVVWEHQKGVPMCVSPLYVKPYLYTVTDAGMVNCLQAATGEVVYQERLRGRYGASPVYADGRIYLLLESGETVVFAPGPQFKILARNPLDEKCQASMAVSGRRFFIRTDKHVYCVR
jgi:outer membrane protein assembly factor BamB